MGVWNKLFIILGVILIISGISWIIYPWFEGDYLVAVIILGVVFLSWGIFNLSQIVLWKKIVFSFLISVVGSIILILVIAFISSFIGGTLPSSLAMMG